MCGHRRQGWTRFEHEMRVAGRHMERGLREAGEELAAAGRQINEELGAVGDEVSGDFDETPRRRKRGSNSYGFGVWTSDWSSRAERKAERRERRRERRHERREARREARHARRMNPFGWLVGYWWLAFPLYYGLRPLWENVGSGIASGVSGLVSWSLNVTPAGPLAHLISDGTGLTFGEAFGLLVLAAGVTGMAAWIGLKGMPRRSAPLR